MISLTWVKLPGGLVSVRAGVFALCDVPTGERLVRRIPTHVDTRKVYTVASNLNEPNR